MNRPTGGETEERQPFNIIIAVAQTRFLKLNGFCDAGNPNTKHTVAH